MWHAAGLAYLARCIDNLRRVILTAIFDHLPKVVFNGGIVAVDKVALDKLHREGGFA